MRRARIWINIALVCAVAFGLRFWGLHAEPPGFEEVVALSLAHEGFMAHLNSPNADLVPPAWLLPLRALLTFGGRLAEARFLALLVGVATAVVLYVAGRRHFHKRAAGIGALLLAMSAPHVFYSQEAQPVALFGLLTVAALILLVRSAEGNRLTDWLAFDVAAVGMVHGHRNGIFVVLAFLLVHVMKPLFFRDPNEVRNTRPGPVLAKVAMHYGIIIAASLPWLVVSLGLDLPWNVEQPELPDFLALFVGQYWFGMTGNAPLHLVLVTGAFYVLLLPPVVRTLRAADFPGFAALGSFVFALALILMGSHLRWERLVDASEAAALTLPLFAIALGVLLARCNLYVRLTLAALAFSLAITGTVRQERSADKVPWRSIAAELRREVQPEDLVVFWPDFTTTMGRYFLDDGPEIVSASDLFQKWADAPDHPRIFFVLSQYPMGGLHAHTFPGALRQYSQAEVAWSQKMNLVMRVREPSMMSLELWYRDPKSLNIIDEPSSATQFIFPPADPAFKNEELFHYKRPDLIYDYADGRRAVWTARKDVELRLPVTLAPGTYELKVHCSPDHYRAETGVLHDRELTVEVRTGEERSRATVTDETTLVNRFVTESELNTLPVHISVSPMLKLGRPDRASLGLKIYSISIDLVEEGGGAL